MARHQNNPGRAELRAAHAGQSGLIWAVGIFSFFANLLLFTGPLYMLQVYDRVLGSQSESTLAALTVLIVGLFLAMGFLDYARGRILARIGARVQDQLDRRVFAAALQRLTIAPQDGDAQTAQRDLESIQRLWASPVVLAIFDMPWTPLFIFAVYIFNFWLGILATVGGIVLVIVALMNQRMTSDTLGQVNARTVRADRVSDLIKLEAESVQALGMTAAAFDRWQLARAEALRGAVAVGDLGGKFSAVTKTFRLFLQSAILGLGALMVLEGQMSAGAMIAASILMGRALQPVEQAVGQWATVTRALDAYARLASLLSVVPQTPTPTALPRPKALLEAQSLTIIPPGEQQAVLRMVSFKLAPGQAMGVIGPSGAGKSSLARALIGVWRPTWGNVRLDGASLDHYDPDILGGYFGYLPQRVTLFDGTIAENIARLQSNADPAKIVEAAQRAAAHEMILGLPDGYDTKVATLGGRLSGGQIQRIGLARALFGNPVILVLDEPNSNLDNDGTVALNSAIRATKEAGGAVLIMAHRPAAIQECDLLLVLEDGMRRAFGPRDQVLRDMVKNHTDIVRTTGQGAAT
jgi:ATP-binding cassette, subfamily C, bacterial